MYRQIERPFRSQSKKYVPDLAGFIALCEGNYRKILRLMPLLDDGEEHHFSVATKAMSAVVVMQILEDTPYTNTLRLQQFPQKNSQGNVPWVQHPEMTVRLYHDAKMVEVLSFQQSEKLAPAYVYPNRRMYQKDEKSQWNIFLSEWLSFCLRCGYEKKSTLVP